MRLRLLHVLVQPVGVLDDGERLTPVNHPAVEVSPEDWPTFSGERFAEEWAAWGKQLVAEAQKARLASKAPRPSATKRKPKPRAKRS